MKKALLIIFCISFYTISFAQGQRTESTIKNWDFCRGEENSKSKWEKVTIPHDWAIFGPFDREYDIQTVAVQQNFEKKASVKTGRTGGLPYVGKGVYKTSIAINKNENKRFTLLFDGAMSEANVSVNGKNVCFWPNGYNSFYCDITDAVVNGDNEIKVNLENRAQSSRWYPGAGLYRNVHLITTSSVHIPVWGTYITTPRVGSDFATVNLKTTLNGIKEGDTINIKTRIIDARGNEITKDDATRKMIDGTPFVQNFTINNPSLWSPETPNLYKAETSVYYKGELADTYSTTFGVRSIEYVADKGFYLNGKHRKFQGVCNHHDLGPLGAAVNESALRYQLQLLRNMGCDAVRTSHNMPTPELVRLCDEMGFMVMVESFDEWDVAKCENGYHRFFNEWAERDMVNMIHNYRNNPSVIMWSIGNEIPTQSSAKGAQTVKFLQDICHREDPTRPVTCGMDMVDQAVTSGFAAELDIPGLNYRTHKYAGAYEKLPQRLILGSETASTVSSRGVYKFPAEKKAHAVHGDNQSSSYDLEYCWWSNIPDEDFALADDKNWTLGQFVWTGFDYLGEPTPYDTDAWPNHSSMFGIIDLSSIPKDRYYLYRSIWNTTSPTLHMLPHWNWKGKEGENIPVFVYTNYPEAELFVNGKSQGKRTKNNADVTSRYRLMWKDVVYQPGEIKVVAYDGNGKEVESKTIKTAGKAHQIKLESNMASVKADGNDLAYITVTVTDKDGNPVPTDNREITFNVSGAGTFKAVANGDPKCLYPFHKNIIPLFSGAATVIVQSSEKSGLITIEAKGKGVKSTKIIIENK